MKAMLVEEFKKRPRVKEVAEPNIRGAFDALVRIHASGVCHTNTQGLTGSVGVGCARARQMQFYQRADGRHQ